MTPSTKPSRRRRAFRLEFRLPLALAVGTLCAGLATTGLVWHSLRAANDVALRAEFDYRVRDLTARIGRRMASYEQILRGTQAYIGASPALPQPQAFRAYVGTLALREHYPGIQGIGIALLDPGRERSAIAMIEPLDVMNRRALGFDMFAEPVRHLAMARARDTGQASLTAPVQLVQEGAGPAQPGFLMYLPLYRASPASSPASSAAAALPAPPADVAGRQAALAGWVYAAFRMVDFLHGVSGEREADLHVAVYDGSPAADRCMAGCGDAPAARLQVTYTLPVAGREWTVRVSGMPVFERRLASQQAGWAGVAGIIVSTLSATLVWLLAQGRARARLRARRVMRALHRSRTTAAAREAERQRDLRDAEHALHRAQKLEAVGKLTGGVAHDFNNVLQVIYSNLQAVLADPRGSGTARRLDGALAAVERGAKLSGQLLAFARRQPVEPVVVNLARVLRNVDDLLRRALGSGIALSTTVEPGLWNTLVDPNRLENVILNLAINARDAMRDTANGGRLEIALSNRTLHQHDVAAVPEAVAGDYVLLAVTDNGSGMAPDVLERVFEPFFTTKPEGEGTGLGLSMAYGFVRQAGGHIRIRSEVGAGTSMLLYFPRTDAPESAGAVAPPPAPLRGAAAPRQPADAAAPADDGGALSVLVVEDNEDLRDLTVEMIATLGYRAGGAASAEAALGLLEEGTYDAVFTDVQLPGISGLELAQRLSRDTDLAIVVVSGRAVGEALPPGVRLLHKPYRIDAVEELLAQIRLARQPTPDPAED